MNRLVVFTGGPGSGKTTLIELLASRGFATSRETGRVIIKQQQTIGGQGLPWRDTGLFAELMLSRDLLHYRYWDRSNGGVGAAASTVFFDRGIPDVAGYLDLLGGPVPDHVMEAARLYRYHDEVFILPPWPAIFANDAERKQDMDEAVRTFEAMQRTYLGLGYRLTELPKASIDERAAFVLGRLDLT